MCDGVVATAAVTKPVPIEEGVDLPDAVADQLRRLSDLGLNASVIFAEADLAILRADQD
jgi:hypothetical protein